MASIRFRFRKFHSKNIENLPVEFRYVAGRRIPEDLPVRIEIRSHDSVPHCHDLPPRHFRMALPQFALTGGQSPRR